MKKILILLALLIGANANAQVAASDLMGLGMPAELATQVVSIASNLVPSADNTKDVGSASVGYRTGYFDTSVVTPLVNHASSLALGIAGTAEATLTNDTLTFSGAAASIVGGATSLTVGSAGSTILKADADANRLLTFDASADAALTLTFGDAGTTATQDLVFSASTSDADDDSTLYITAGGAVGVTRGAFFRANGNEAGSPGSAYVSTSSIATADLALRAQDDITLETSGGTAVWTVDTATGNFVGAGTTSIGWTPVAGANTACNTTCTAPCVFGIDSAAPQTWLLCTDATADMCLCAGAS